MKKIITALVALSLTATPAMAHGGWQPNPYRDRHDNSGAIALGILGGIIVGAVIANEQNQQRQQPPAPVYRDDYPQDGYGRPDYPQRAVARCMDGTLHYRWHDPYTCYRHGGVRYWF